MVTVIEFVTESLGDNIAFSPYADLYQKKHGGTVYVKTKWNNIFITDNQNVKFVSKTEEVQYNIYHKLYMLFKPGVCLQQVACLQLGLDYIEIIPTLKMDSSLKINKKKKYVCISVQSTAQMKYWNNNSGWDKVVRYLKKLGYDVLAIDKDEVFGTPQKWNRIPSGAINETGNYSIDYRIQQIKNCEFFLGLSSGLSWVAFALKKKAIVISGCTEETNEFNQGCYRVINKNVCHGCLNDDKIENIGQKLISAGWMWCPRNKSFECTKEISFEMVKQKIDQCIKDTKSEVSLTNIINV